MAATHVWFLGIALLMMAACTHVGHASCVDGEVACEESDDVALMQFRVREQPDKALLVSDESDSVVDDQPAQESNAPGLNEVDKARVALAESDAVGTAQDKLQDAQPVAGIPMPLMRVNISLDLKPRERMKAFVRQHKNHMLPFAMRLWSTVAQSFSADKIEEWWQAIHGKFPVLEDELAGMVDVFNENGGFCPLTVKELTLMNMIYELGSPSLGKGCSGLIAQLPDGSIAHGRNLDYVMPYDTTKVTFELTFYRGQTPIFISAGQGLVGIATGMRVGGWSFEQNTRFPLDAAVNLQNAKSGAVPYSFAVREIMETTPDFGEALRKLEGTRFIANSYFVLTGTKSDEGAVFAVDANISHALPYTTTISLQSTFGRWFLIQTNDDQWSWPHDPRRPLAYAKINQLHQNNMTMGEVEKFMTTFPLFTPLTVMTWVCNVKKGTHMLIAHPVITAVQGALGKAGLIPGR